MRIGQAEGSMERLGDALDEKVGDAIKRLGVPSRDEIAQLTKSVEELTVKVDSLKSTPKQPQAKAAPKKAQAKKTTSKAN